MLPNSKLNLPRHSCEISLMVLNWLLPRLENLRFRLQTELGFAPTEERWERPDEDRYFRESDR